MGGGVIFERDVVSREEKRETMEVDPVQRMLGGVLAISEQETSAIQSDLQSQA